MPVGLSTIIKDSGPKKDSAPALRLLGRQQKNGLPEKTSAGMTFRRRPFDAR
jgi:hypothetical protein